MMTTHDSTPESENGDMRDSRADQSGSVEQDTTRSLCSTTMNSPVGVLTLVASDRGLRAVLWEDDAPSRVRLAEVSEDGGGHATLCVGVSQLTEYFAGTRTEFDMPLDPDGTAFQQSAWTALRDIPYGQTWTYGEQAAHIGDRNKARAVGAANGRNPISIIVPCHRVVGSNGSLTGFAGGLDAKRWLLAHERRVAGITLV